MINNVILKHLVLDQAESVLCDLAKQDRWRKQQVAKSEYNERAQLLKAQTE